MDIKIFMASRYFESSFVAHLPNHVRNIEDADLVIFPGGADINPEIYGEGNVASYAINKVRDKQEIDIYHRAVKFGKKMLGVCRGHQLLMALNGGKLIQDIKCHPGYHDLEIFYPDLVPLSNVNSLHHQGISVESVPKKFLVTSAFDGVVESAHSELITTVQWHPEFMGISESRAFFNFVRGWVHG